jgi:hypothetical protein
VNFAVAKSKTEDISDEPALVDPRPAGSDEGREFGLEIAKPPGLGGIQPGIKVSDFVRLCKRLKALKNLIECK